MATQRVENVKPHILRQCREQIGLSIAQAQKKAGLKTLEKIEQGETKPTFNQLEKLAERYHVPQWVFLKEKLPNKYHFTESIPAFRNFADESPIFDDYKVRSVTANVGRFRELILELRNDMGEPVQPFSPPKLTGDITQKAMLVRQWLGCSKDAYTFSKWKQAIEAKGVFVFMTSKYNGWSQIELKLFRGLSIYQDILPIIIINDSDAYKAQSFTLFHELGHLLKKQSALDSQEEQEQQEQQERWCDQFSGEVLMPRDAFLRETKTFSPAEQVHESVSQIQKMANQFCVSPYAFTVRMRHMKIINQREYKEIISQLKQYYKKLKEEKENSELKFSRNIAREALSQYGNIYATAVVQTYRNQEIGLHKLCKLLGIKKATDALKLETLL